MEGIFMEDIKREGGISLDDFYKFCKEMNEHHAFGVMGPTFAAKYIDSCVDTRDGEVWMVTLRDIVADDDIWSKIPEDWKRRSGNAVHISIREFMDDGFQTLKDRLDFILGL